MVSMGLIARAVKSGRDHEALELMTSIWDGDICAAVYALREVFDVDVEERYPLITPRLP